MLRRDPASFRDPDGFVFSVEGTHYRSLTPQARLRLIDGQAFSSAAIERGLLLPFELDVAAPDGAGLANSSYLRPETIELVTYPYEWGFEQLKDAALATLDVNLLALEHGLTLKDASAFNIQRHGGRMVLIDHTSFEPTDGRLPWRPYSQFCRHFLAPLIVASYRDLHAASFFRMHLDGLPLETASDLLPWRACFVPSIAMHMLLHNRFIRRSAEFEARSARAKRAGAEAVPSRGRQRDLLRQLRAFIRSLVAATPVSNWANYYGETNYDEASFAKKKELVAASFARRRFGTIWDLGANNGTFSRLIAGSADLVLALDLDHNAVNAGYAANKEGGHRAIHSLVYDSCNPTPALGFNNEERSTLEQRSKADCALALAVIHHLSIASNIPLDRSADYFADRADELVIEFVGPGDSQVKRLLAQKNVSYDWYTEENFQRAFSRRFNLEWRQPIPGTDRSLFRLTALK